MVEKLRMDIPSVIRELEVALKVLTEARIMSRYRRVFKGKGLEFEDFRDYTTSDDASLIDWKASKRSNKIVIRRFKEERDMNIFILLDVSSSMLFGSTEKLKYEYAAEMVAALANFVLQSGDRVSLVMFTDRVVRYVKPGKGIKHFYIMLKHLLNPRYYGGGFNIGSALNFIMNATGEKSIAFLISDFIGMEETWERSIKLSAGKFDGIAVMVRDPRDEKLPPGTGQVVIADPYSDKEMLIDDNRRDREEYGRYVRSQEEQLRKSLMAGMWDYVEVSTKDSFVMPIIKFFKRRELLLR